MAPDCDFNTTGPAITTAQEFFVAHCITFVFLLLCVVPFRVQLVTGCDTLHKLHCFNIFTGVFVKIFCIWNIITGLYWVACQSGHFQAPVPKIKRDKHELNQQPLQPAPPLIDEYIAGIQTRQTLVIDDNSSLLTPLTIEKPKQKEAFQMTKQPEQYGPPCSLCGSFNHSPKYCYKGERDINNIMEKMSINPHQSQQSNLYQ